MDLRNLKFELKIKLSELNKKTLELAYNELVRTLNRHYALETQKTKAEEIAYSMLKRKSNIKIFRSFWIGNTNIDIFILNATYKSSNKKFRGIAIEIDGAIHDKQFKMNKDQNKYTLLHNLGIALLTFENDDLDSITSKNVLADISKIQRLDFRAKQRLLYKIWLMTIISQQQFIKDNNLSLCKSILNLLESDIYELNKLFKN